MAKRFWHSAQAGANFPNGARDVKWPGAEEESGPWGRRPGRIQRGCDAAGRSRDCGWCASPRDGPGAPAQGTGGVSNSAWRI